MSESDTPRTDEYCLRPTHYSPGQERLLIPGWIDFARRIERELSHAMGKLRNTTWQDHADAWQKRALRAEAECDSLREDAERYRWWKRHYSASVEGESFRVSVYLPTQENEGVDAAIDSARKEIKS